MTSSVVYNSILVIAFISNFAQINNAYVQNTWGTRATTRWATCGQQTTTSLKMSAVDNSITAEEINSRLAAQLEKLKAKDATSSELTKEVRD